MLQEEAHAAGGPACTSNYSIYGKALSDGSSAVMILNREQATIPLASSDVAISDLDALSGTWLAVKTSLVGL